jgi:hypothetical protein
MLSQFSKPFPFIDTFSRRYWCVLFLFTFPCVLNRTVSLDQYTRNCKQEIHTPALRRKRVYKSDLILKTGAAYRICTYKLKQRSWFDDFHSVVTTELPTYLFQQPAVYARIRIRKAIWNCWDARNVYWIENIFLSNTKAMFSHIPSKHLYFVVSDCIISRSFVQYLIL